MPPSPSKSRTTSTPPQPDPQAARELRNARVDTTDLDILVNGELVEGITIAILPQLDGTHEATVLVVESLDVADGAVVRVRGSRPLVVVATDQIDIAGLLDASADGVLGGPGADLACSTGKGEDGVLDMDTAGDSGGTGGGGGGYGGAGGAGGAISSPVPPPAISVGGFAWGTQSLSPLLGGCAGGAGGTVSGQVATGGGGGGALQLVAASAISISGAVSVSGGGGRPRLATENGGGGGGSGGAILLQTPALTVTGFVTSNGGGGGGNTMGADGATNSDVPASGGGSGNVGRGGDGGVVGTGTNGDPGEGSPGTPRGGGGGGGGVGRIAIDAAATNLAAGTFSPTPATL